MCPVYLIKMSKSCLLSACSTRPEVVQTDCLLSVSITWWCCLSHHLARVHHLIVVIDIIFRKRPSRTLVRHSGDLLFCASRIRASRSSASRSSARLSSFSASSSLVLVDPRIQGYLSSVSLPPLPPLPPLPLFSTVFHGFLIHIQASPMYLCPR